MSVLAKVCGVMTPRDAVVTGEAGADFMGVILSPGYSRSVEPEQALAVYAAGRGRRVGVFVDAAAGDVVRLARELGLDVIQLGGSEAPGTVARIGGAGGWRVWKTVHARAGVSMAAAAGLYAEVADGILVDSWDPGRPGGTGRAFSWAGVGREVREAIGSATFIAAGGMNPDNAGAAVEALAPDVLDVSSGVESVFGAKDPGKTRAFVRAVQLADNPSRRRTRVSGSLVQAGRYGPYGGRYVPETLIPALDELTEAYARAMADPAFLAEVDHLSADYVGRPTPLYRARRFEAEAGIAPVYLKREDLNHTGAHKINNTVGQALLAKRMGKPRIIAETGAGQHGVATATACALFDLECVVYMGTEDVERQSLNVYRMELLGAEVRPVESGTRTLKDATNEALRDWVTNVGDTHYIIGSVVGPHPFPEIVRDFQAVIGREARRQILEVEGRLPASVVACVGGGSNAMGMFHAFVGDEGVALIGVEAAGYGIGSGHSSAPLCEGRPGVLHGSLSYLLQDADGQIAPAHSVAAGLDYPGVGPEHSQLKDTGRAMYVSVEDGAAERAFRALPGLEGIIPALETAHALAYVVEAGRRGEIEAPVAICLSGRGDKDVVHVSRLGDGEGGS